MSAKEDVSKLPKWAQTEINRLRRDLSDAEEHIAGLFTQDPSAIEYEPYRKHAGKKRTFLPDYATIAFKVYGGIVHARIEGDRLHIMGESMTEHLSVMPSCSNVLTIGFEDRK